MIPNVIVKHTVSMADHPGYGLESDPQSKVQSKDAGTQIVGVRKSFPGGTSPLQTCEQIEEDVD